MAGSWVMAPETAIKIPGQALDAGKDASNTLINQGPLGALVILLSIAVGILIWLLYKSKNAHISDKDTMAKVMNQHSLEVQGMLKDTRHAIDSLAKDTSHLNQSMKEHKTSLENLLRDNDHLHTSVDNTKKSVDDLTTQWQIWNIKRP